MKMSIFYKTDIKNIFDKEKNKLNYRSEPFNVLWIRENFKSLKHLVDKFKEEDDIIFEIFNKKLKIYYYIKLDNINNEINNVIKKHKENQIKEDLLKIIYTDFVNYDKMESFLLLNKLSNNSPLKNISINLLDNLIKKSNKKQNYRLCITIKNKYDLLNPKLIISINLYVSKIENKKILKKRYIPKFGDALEGNLGVTEKTNEDIYIESMQTILLKKHLEKQRLKILSNVNEKYKAKKKKEFISIESEDNSNVYCPPKRTMTSENDKCIVFLSGFPMHVEEEEIYLKINDYLNENKTDNNYILPSQKFKKRIKNINLIKKNNNCFSFLTFYNKEDADAIINASYNKKLHIEGGILTASYKK